MTNTATYLPTQWDATPYGEHWSFAYNLANIEREEYDFTVEFHESISEQEQLAVINLIETAPKLLAVLAKLVEQERANAAAAGMEDDEMKWLEEARSVIAEATAVSPASTPSEPWSVLLLYPDYINDRGDETYYAFVEASDAIEAVAVAQRQAVAAQEGVDTEPDDFAPLLVTQGHHTSEPLFNK